MSIFDTILSAIFGPSAQTHSAQPGQSMGAPPGAAVGAAVGQTAQSGLKGQTVDVEAVLSERAAHKKERLDWRRSIVDLMKVLDLDSGLSSRKQLAQELGYKGELNGSAEMNIWLHKQVMQRLAANGGRVPADLAH